MEGGGNAKGRCLFEKDLSGTWKERGQGGAMKEGQKRGYEGC